MDSNPILIWISNKPWIKKTVSKSKIIAGIVSKAATLTKYHFICTVFIVLGMVYIVIKNKQVVLIN